VSQAKPHRLALHVAVELAGAEHATHEFPHELGLTSLEHTEPHAWKSVLQLNPQWASKHVV
jgi:hypothetical protein